MSNNSNKHIITIIDDSWPYDHSVSLDSNILTYDNVKRFVDDHSYEWKEKTLQHFIKNLVNRSLSIEEVEIIGFYHIQHYLDALETKLIELPKLMVVDWDFGAGFTAAEFLPQFLQESIGIESAYIFSRSENMNIIQERLIYPDIQDLGISVFLYDKGNRKEFGATLEKLVDRLLRKVEDVNGRTFKYYGELITFYTSGYLDHYLDFWRVPSIVGKDTVLKVIKDHDLTLDKKVLENIFKSAKVDFFVDQKEELLFSTNSPKFEKPYGKLTKISALDVLKNFGIKKMDRVLEASIVKVK